MPLYRRRVYALAAYTMTRRSELAALMTADVDLAYKTITSRSRATEGTKPRRGRPRPGRTRTIDIEPHLFPLLDLLMKDAGDGRLLRVPPSEDCAELLREDLWTVGVRRSELHRGDATRTPMLFHNLRDTGLTHMAVRGDSPIVIQWRGGHTTYLERGRVEARRIGEPLPQLPGGLLDIGLDNGGEHVQAAV